MARSWKLHVHRVGDGGGWLRVERVSVASALAPELPKRGDSPWSAGSRLFPRLEGSSLPRLTLRLGY